MNVQLKRVSFNKEKQILVNLIISDKFCSSVINHIRPEYFRSKSAQLLLKWVKEYYNTYKKAPNTIIQQIYEDKSQDIDKDLSIQIETILQHLSDISDVNVQNIDYLISTTNTFCKKRHLELQNIALEKALQDNDLSLAEQIADEKYIDIDTQQNRFITFSDNSIIRDSVRALVAALNPEEAFFRFSGALGDFIGPLQKQFFVAFLAPAKRGKTTYMLSSAIDSIFQKRNTVIISLEMPVQQLMSRYCLAVAGAYPERRGYTVRFPLMDCKHNQDGSCENPQCPMAGSLLNDNGTLLTYKDMPDWEVCTHCRGTSGFVPASWVVHKEQKYVSEGAYLKKIRSFNKFFGKYGRIIHIPSKTSTVSDLRTIVDELKYNENFIPEVLIIDYADLIKPDYNSGAKRHDLDDIWEQLRSWEQEEHLLLITASQTNRISADAAYLKDTHVAEDYSKIAKLDIGIGLCQTDAMKLACTMNINIVAHRHSAFVQSDVCTVLQCIDLQQAVLDSEFIRF